MKEIKLLSEAETEQIAMQCNENEEKNSKVFHYTSVDTLVKLFNKIKDYDGEPCFVFHASDIFSQNDAQEVKFGFEQLSSILTKYEKSHGINDKNVQLSKYLDASTQGVKVRNLILDNLSKTADKFFTLSFSQLKDDFNMWHLYGDDCNGVALQFNEFDLKRIHSEDITLFLTVEYGNATNSDDIHNNIKPFYEKYLGEVENNKTNIEVIQLKWILVISELVCSAIKHQSFAHENEKRLIIGASKYQHFKYKMNHNKNIIPYLKVYVPLRYLEKITLGPCADTENLMRVLEMMRKTYNMNFQISKSEAPYRKY